MSEIVRCRSTLKTESWYSFWKPEMRMPWYKTTYNPHNKRAADPIRDLQIWCVPDSKSHWTGSLVMWLLMDAG